MRARTQERRFTHLQQLADENRDDRCLPGPRHNEDQRIIFHAKDFVHRVQWGRIPDSSRLGVEGRRRAAGDGFREIHDERKALTSRLRKIAMRGCSSHAPYS